MGAKGSAAAQQHWAKCTQVHCRQGGPRYPLSPGGNYNDIATAGVAGAYVNGLPYPMLLICFLRKNGSFSPCQTRARYAYGNKPLPYVIVRAHSSILAFLPPYRLPFCQAVPSQRRCGDNEGGLCTVLYATCRGLRVPRTASVKLRLRYTRLPVLRTGNCQTRLLYQRPLLQQ